MKQQHFTCELLQRNLLTTGNFELVLSRPRAFTFRPGQRIRLFDRSQERDYSLVNAPDDSSLRLCIRLVTHGSFSTNLHSAGIGTRFDFTGPHGHFVLRHSNRPAVFVATGTGAAPFASMARAGSTGFTLLHGVRSTHDLFYTDLFQSSAGNYIACVSGEVPASANDFHGRVTEYIERELPDGIYDFYLCGRRDMVRDVTWLLDERFPESRVYNEIFY